MRLFECSTGVWPVDDVRLGAESDFFRGQDARAPLFRGCLPVPVFRELSALQGRAKGSIRQTSLSGAGRFGLLNRSSPHIPAPSVRPRVERGQFAHRGFLHKHAEV